jgi:osmotically-inducible protein OsmY
VARRTAVGKIEQALQAAGIFAAVEESKETIVLTGLVESEATRQAASDIVASVAPGRPIDNSLEVPMTLPETLSDLTSSDPSPSDLPNSLQDIADAGLEFEPDFTDQRVLSDPVAAPGDPDQSNDPVQEGDEVYSPPTDPVIALDDQGYPRVLGGFSETSTDDVSVARSASDGKLGDEAIAEAVRRELKEDAATTDLHVLVYVEQGIVRLSGQVATLDDADNAESVAARVPGVVEVREELEVLSI